MTATHRIQPFNSGKQHKLWRVLFDHYMECCEYQSDEEPNRNAAAQFAEQHLAAFEDTVIDFVGERYFSEMEA